MIAFNLESKVSTNGHSTLGFFGRLKKSVKLGLDGFFSDSRGYSKESEEEKEKQRFADSIKVKYKIEGDRLSRIVNVVEQEYSTSKGFKTREGILKEEEQFAKNYKEFKNHSQLNSGNFIAKAIVEKVNGLYKTYNGKKSLGRIFAEIKSSRCFNVELGYNERENRYEVRVGNKVEDIRNLKIRDSQRNMNFAKSGVTYDDYVHGRIDEETKYKIKRNVIHSLDYYAGRYARDLKAFGINVFYNGVDSVLEERYNVSEASHHVPPRRPSYSLIKKRSIVARPLELVGAF